MRALDAILLRCSGEQSPEEKLNFPGGFSKGMT